MSPSLWLTPLRVFKRNACQAPVLLGLLMCLGASMAWSQATSTATLTGLVTDEQNAVIAGAEVRITDSATGSTNSTLTNDQGRYVIVNVSPGTYSISISK